MTYAPLNYTHYDLLAGIVFTICLLSIATGIALYAILLGKNKMQQLANMVTVFSAVIGLTLIGSIFLFIMDEETNHANQTIATKNLSQKYEFKDILWQNPETTAYANGHIRDGRIVLLTQDGEEKSFIYTVNPQTHEPTLSSPPNEPGATAESLQKEPRP